MALPLRLYFVLAFALTWGIGCLALLLGFWFPGSHPLATTSPLYYLAGYSVSAAGLALTARYDGRDGVRRLAQRLAPWRSSVGWYVAVIAGYAAITGLTLQTASVVRSTPVVTPQWSSFLVSLLIAVVRDPGPLGEEFGWRGFALPRLLELRSPVVATVTLGLLHAAWHLPLFFISGMPQTQVSFPLFTVGVLAIAVVDTALYLRTGANLLLAILVHLLANVCGNLAADAHALHYFFLFEGLAAIIVVSLGGLRSTTSVPRTVAVASGS